MKKLSEKISKEVWFNPSYAIARFMESKKAFKTEQDQPMLATAKIIREEGILPQLQLHFRFKGKDKWNKLNETLDFDIYIPLKEVKKLVEVFEWQI
jgi:hypothetical protein